jgi:hypothetical protein
VHDISKEYGQSIPVILLTMVKIENPQIEKRFQENTIAKYLSKDANSSEIIEAIESVIEKGAQEEIPVIEIQPIPQNISISITPKIALQSALYAVLLLPFAFLLNIAMEWFLNNVIISMFNWFNQLSLFWKIIAFFLGGTIILSLVVGLFKMVGTVLSFLIFGRLPENNFTVVFSLLVFLLSCYLMISSVWQITPSFTVWIFLEFIVLVVFILSINSVLLPWYLKRKAAMID